MNSLRYSRLACSHIIFAVIKACLAAGVAALIAGVTIVATIVVFVIVGGTALAGVFGFGGSRFAARRRAKRGDDSGTD